jgi:hypothetical protein
MPAAALGAPPREVFGEDRVSVVPDLADAIDQAATLAEAGRGHHVSDRRRGGARPPARSSPWARPARC